MYSRETGSLQLPPTIRQKLQAAGFRTVKDLHEIGPIDLAREASLTHQEALSVLKVVPGRDLFTAVAGAKSATELLQEERARISITTMCPELDELLGGGVAPGEITEFCGVPGIGKTQIGMQVAVSVHIPRVYGGLGGHAIYIDTEGSLMAERVVDMAEAIVRKVNAASAASASSSDRGEGGLTVEQIIANVHYFRVHTATEQRALLHSLEDFVLKHPEVRVVVIDSIAFHYRQDFPDMSQRTRILNEVVLLLMSLANKHRIAIVTMNQVTTRILAGGASKLVPALGESFAHACTTRVILFWDNGERNAQLYKSPRLPPGTVAYSVTEDGIRGTREIELGLGNIDNKRPRYCDDE
mmetsp:Transcript_37411/g.62981  ORF Transcript_37411/g.62981 Transcript_37411/m.62981 type:complete len:355 (+) Transcript_37411:330-1394(+)|eukprot:CAMPEP_0198216682 /NCGR_PEP_ID=MMETSP1445-20131203/59012_1 /TAXON_ID=36898 /ORGANISM="Pyramimonas sp., Strain CCMP2087" /LENGTH=354 /DNA_ID=CAMNT_0043893023 /DNA_START=278 /DNA_END=1342 /DNA_ORIENTATION=+